jgi:hypothetical protein
MKFEFQVCQQNIYLYQRNLMCAGVSIWNYNANAELSYAGVRCARFYANGRPINGIGSVLLRKAPGSKTDHFNLLSISII